MIKAADCSTLCHRLTFRVERVGVVNDATVVVTFRPEAGCVSLGPHRWQDEILRDPRPPRRLLRPQVTRQCVPRPV